MLSIAPPPTIYLHTGSTDMRKSFDGLSGIIRGTCGADPSDGSLFLFVKGQEKGQAFPARTSKPAAS